MEYIPVSQASELSPGDTVFFKLGSEHFGKVLQVDAGNSRILVAFEGEYKPEEEWLSVSAYGRGVEKVVGV